MTSLDPQTLLDYEKLLSEQSGRQFTVMPDMEGNGFYVKWDGLTVSWVTRVQILKDLKREE